MLTASGRCPSANSAGVRTSRTTSPAGDASSSWLPAVGDTTATSSMVVTVSAAAVEPAGSLLQADKVRAATARTAGANRRTFTGRTSGTGGETGSSQATPDVRTSFRWMRGTRVVRHRFWKRPSTRAPPPNAGTLHFLSATDGRAARLEEAQLTHQDGPCFTAYRTGKLVSVDDIRTDDRWPAYRQEAVDLGYGSVLGVPMPVRTETIGALDLYRDEPGPRPTRRSWPASSSTPSTRATTSAGSATWRPTSSPAVWCCLAAEPRPSGPLSPGPSALLSAALPTHDGGRDAPPLVPSSGGRRWIA